MRWCQDPLLALLEPVDSRTVLLDEQVEYYEQAIRTSRLSFRRTLEARKLSHLVAE